MVATQRALAQMKVYTIGFTRKTASEFFELLKGAGIGRVLDVRLNNTSQLAGFAKRDDLSYFLKFICGAEYIHELMLAPTPEILEAFKKRRESWEEYESAFSALMVERRVAERLDRRLFDIPCALLCSEPTPDHCHRRLVLEHLQERWGSIEICHL